MMNIIKINGKRYSVTEIVDVNIDYNTLVLLDPFHGRVIMPLNYILNVISGGKIVQSNN